MGWVVVLFGAGTAAIDPSALGESPFKAGSLAAAFGTLFFGTWLAAAWPFPGASCVPPVLTAFVLPGAAPVGDGGTLPIDGVAGCCAASGFTEL